MMGTSKRAAFALFALGLAAAACAQDFSADEDAQLEALLAKRAAAKAAAAARTRRASSPQVQTKDGNVVIAVEGGKKVGYKVGGDTVYFNDLPKQYMAEDSKCFSALSIGYTLGQSSPSTVGITDLIKEKIDGSAKTLTAQMSTALDKTDKDMRKAVADFSACLAKGQSQKNGKCVAAPWAVSSDSGLTCDATHDGSLKYDKTNTALLICVGSTKKWTRVSPPNPPDLGAFEASAGKDCATIKKAGYSAGSKFYWTTPGGKAALVFCNMKKAGEEVYDGSDKTKPAPSCKAIDKYYENLNLEATEKRWIAAKGGAIELLCDTTSGGVRQWGPGTSKDYPAKSCQQSLDVFKALKTGDKIYKSTDDGKVAEVKCIVSGGKATSNPDGTSKEGAAHSCMSIKALGGTKSGNYWVKLTKYGGSVGAYQVYCEQSWNGGGWTMLYFTTYKQRGATEWALNWDAVTTKGKRFDAKWSTSDNYLMPMHHWSTFNKGTFVMRSQSGGQMVLTKWQIEPPNKYRMNWKDYVGAGNERSAMQEHRNRALSTVERDNDSWGSNCANHAKSFGWYGACCNLCMTSNAGGSWRARGLGGTYVPVDWYYRGTQWMYFYAKLN